MYKYYFYNANPKGLFTDDCVCRAISVAEGTSWEQCHKKLSDLSRQQGMILNDVDFIEDHTALSDSLIEYEILKIGNFAK